MNDISIDNIQSFEIEEWKNDQTMSEFNGMHEIFPGLDNEDMLDLDSFTMTSGTSPAESTTDAAFEAAFHGFTGQPTTTTTSSSYIGSSNGVSSTDHYDSDKNDSFEDLHSIPTAEIFKSDVKQEGFDFVDAFLSTSGCMKDISPASFTYSSPESWDTIADDIPSSQAVHIDQQLLSPTSEYTTDANDDLVTPQLSPASSSSGYNSSSPPYSPASSPESSPPSSLASPDRCAGDLLTTSPPPSLILPTPLTATFKTTGLNSPQTQYIIQKHRPATNKFTTINTKGAKATVFNGIISSSFNKTTPSLSFASSSSTISGSSIGNIVTTVPRIVTTSSKINPPTIINRSQLSSGGIITATASNTTTTNATKLLHHKSSLTLSGVNKTAQGIIKSPSVLAINRKQILTNVVNSNSNNISSLNSINGNNTVVCSSVSNADFASFISNSNGNASPVYQTVTVSNNNRNRPIYLSKKISTLTHGKILKAGQKGKPVQIHLSQKDLEKLRTVKIIGSTNGSMSGATTITTDGTTILRTANGLVPIVPNRQKIHALSGVTTVTSGTGLRTTTNKCILNNISVPITKTMQRLKEGYSSLVAIPKEEAYDSDDDFEMPKKVQPLVLSDEEKKIATKEKITFPSHYPLNPQQEKNLRGIKRKIRNKISAQESRKRKKEYVDKLEEKLDHLNKEMEKFRSERDIVKSDRDRLKIQMAHREETIKKLTEQLKKFQVMLSNQQAPSVSHNTSNNNNSKQPQSQAFFMLVVLSLAFLICPSMMQQGKTATELLTAVAHKGPQAGNTRSLLEATKLVVCPDDDLEMIDDKATIAALNDHDYTPPAKRGRYTLLPTRHSYQDDNFCSATTDPPANQEDRKTIDSDVWWTDIDGLPTIEEKVTIVPEESLPLSEILDLKLDVDLVPPIKLEPELNDEFLEKQNKDVEAMMKLLEDATSNRTDHDKKKAPYLDPEAQSLIVKLVGVANNRHFREDSELE